MSEEESNADGKLAGAVDVEAQGRTQSHAPKRAPSRAPSLRRLDQLRSWKDWVQDVIAPAVTGGVPRGDGLSTRCGGRVRA